MEVHSIKLSVRPPSFSGSDFATKADLLTTYNRVTPTMRNNFFNPMGYIYCLYASHDGNPRYIGKTFDDPSYRLKQHVTAALQKSPGPLYEWVRETWRRGAEVRSYTLQEDIIPKELDNFERYWMRQFFGLFNVAANVKPVQRDTKIGAQVRVSLQQQCSEQDD
jgi:hypothetical protein